MVYLSKSKLNNSFHDPGDQILLDRIVQWAKTIYFRKRHCWLVCRYAGELFDLFKNLHGLSLNHRLWLQAAALLHDIAKEINPEQHHKAAMELIIQSDHLPFTDKEKVIIGLIARYHRKAMPASHHRYYRDLTLQEKKVVRILSAILRLADGLEAGRNQIQEFAFSMDSKRIQLFLYCNRPISLLKVITKGKLFTSAFSRDLEFIIAIKAAVTRIPEEMNNECPKHAGVA